MLWIGCGLEAEPFLADLSNQDGKLRCLYIINFLFRSFIISILCVGLYFPFNLTTNQSNVT